MDIMAFIMLGHRDTLRRRCHPYFYPQMSPLLGDLLLSCQYVWKTALHSASVPAATTFGALPVEHVAHKKIVQKGN
jgi:hypothetical protein